MEEMTLPLTGASLEKVIRKRRYEITLPISDKDWVLLKQVRETKDVSDRIGYQKLIRSRFVFEYHYQQDRWFDLNPILEEGLME